MKKHSNRLVAVLAVLAIIAVAAVGGRFIVHAQTAGGSLDGWAWSSNVGWNSASSSDSGAGGGPYGVTVDSSGNLSGYMWSSNIGWIKFGGLSGFPSNGTTYTNATVDTSGNVYGWARACAGTAPGDCSSMTSRTDGWDGWIELSGTNHPTGDLSGDSGVTLNPLNGQFTGYAWGSDVVGWIDFNTVAIGNYTPPSNDFTVTGSSVSFNSTNDSVPATAQVTVAGTAGQTVNLSFGTFASSSDLLVQWTGTTTCSLTSSNPSCLIPVSISLENTRNPQSSYSIPVVGTTTSNTQTGQISVSVDTTCTPAGCNGCIGACNPINPVGSGPTISSCNIPLGPFPSPYLLDLSNPSSIVTLSSPGAGAPYQYYWDINDTGDFVQMESTSLLSNTPVSVEVVDNAGATSSPPMSCGTVTVTGSDDNGGAATVPELWPTSVGASGRTFASSTAGLGSVAVTATPPFDPMNIRTGSNASVSYTWPTSSLSDCVENPISGSSWNGSQLIPPASGSNGVSAISGLSQGIYFVNYTCSEDGSGAPLTSPIKSNTLEIDVASSTIGEQ